MRAWLAGCVLGLFSVGAHGAPDTWVVAVDASGSRQRATGRLRYARLDAERFLHVMKTMNGDVSGSRLSEPTRREFLDFLRKEEKTRIAGKFVFYFSGHADERGIELADGTLPRAELLEALAAVGARTRVVILDACHSGALIPKGAEAAIEFEIPRLFADEPSGSIFLTSAAASRVAFESESLQGSVFSHNLIEALAGGADDNRDGVVTTDEAYLFTYRKARKASLLSPIDQIPEFSTRTAGRGAVILSRPARNTARLVLGEDVRGQVFIETDGGLPFWIVEKSAGERRTIALPPGHYRIVEKDGTSTRAIAVQLDLVREVSGGELRKVEFAPLGRSKGAGWSIDGEWSAGVSGATGARMRQNAGAAGRAGAFAGLPMGDVLGRVGLVASAARRFNRQLAEPRAGGWEMRWGAAMTMGILWRGEKFGTDVHAALGQAVVELRTHGDRSVARAPLFGAGFSFSIPVGPVEMLAQIDGELMSLSTDHGPSWQRGWYGGLGMRAFWE